ncbi:permease-like cell division protein FtsX [Saccharothrix sp. Mg75]|uniref:permease-like cell division protein FtsX n=1 Tax=Saccharothrix sp. Mg75 TaxID=3445357 RepID=UPI003EE9360C
MRRPVTVAAFGAVVVATAAVALLVPDHRVEGAPSARCSLIELTLQTDEEMRAAEAALRGDPRVRELEARTRQENYERFKELFADHPDVVELARPEALPATITMAEAVGADGRALADELGRFGKAEYTDLCALRRVHG